MLENLKGILLDPKVKEKINECELIAEQKEKLQAYQKSFFEDKMKDLEKKFFDINLTISKMNKNIFSIFLKNKIKELELEAKVLKNNILDLKYSMIFYQRRDEYYVNRFLNYLDNKLLKLLNEMISLGNINTLKDMGLSLEQAIKILTENNIDISLDENDLDAYNKENSDIKIKGLEDLFLVHGTNNNPNENYLKTSYELGRDDNKEFDIVTVNGVKVKRSSEEFENVLHFSINSLEEGINSYKNIVIVPISSVPKGKIINFSSNNIIVEGGMPLDNDCYILCREEDYSTIKTLNPNTNIIKCKGKKLEEYLNIAIKILNCKVESKDSNLEECSGNKTIEEILDKNDFKVTTDYFNTKEGIKEKSIQNKSQIVLTLNSINNSFIIGSVSAIIRFCKSVYEALKDNLNEFLINSNNQNIQSNLKDLEQFLNLNNVRYNKKVFSTLENFENITLENIDSVLTDILPSDLNDEQIFVILNNYKENIIEYLGFIIVTTLLYETYKFELDSKCEDKSKEKIKTM